MLGWRWYYDDDGDDDVYGYVDGDVYGYVDELVMVMAMTRTLCWYVDGMTSCVVCWWLLLCYGGVDATVTGWWCLWWCYDD